MEKSTIFIGRLLSASIRVKEIHWNTDTHSTHTLADTIYESLTNIIDAVAENVMGFHDSRIEIGTITVDKFKSDLNTLDDVLKFLERYTKKFISVLSKVSEPKINYGLISILEDYLNEISKYQYLTTLK